MYEIQKIDPNDLISIEKLAELYKCLIEDEGHPNQMNVQPLALRMSGWLATEYQSYVLTQDGGISAYCLFRDDVHHFYLR